MDTAGNKNIRLSKIMLAMSVFVLLLITYTSLFNVYHFAWIGAVFEFLWLPVMAMVFILPVTALIYWIKDKFRLRSVYPIILLICIISMWLLFSISDKPNG
ncbi:MAG: hypothetical protein ABIO79_14150 [Ferruginibacter sp.]